MFDGGLVRVFAFNIHLFEPRVPESHSKCVCMIYHKRLVELSGINLVNRFSVLELIQEFRSLNFLLFACVIGQDDATEVAFHFGDVQRSEIVCSHSEKN